MVVDAASAAEKLEAVVVVLSQVRRCVLEFLVSLSELIQNREPIVLGTGMCFT